MAHNKNHPAHFQKNSRITVGLYHILTKGLILNFSVSDHALFGVFQAAEAARAKHAQALTAGESSVLAAMRTAMWMGKEDIPIKKFTSLINFQKLQGCEDIINLYKADNASYSSRASGMEFQETIAEAIHRDLLDELKKAKMFSVLIDESTDIAVS